MDDTARFETDPFLVLLTDALRAGPGSPQWHQAIEELRARNLQDADEYRLICTVREHLASGREYRSIRPGPGFTRKVMQAVEREAERIGRRPSVGTVIAGLGAVLVLATVVALAIRLVGDSQQGQVPDELAGVFAGTIIAPRDLAGGVGPEWRTIGEAPVPSRDRRGLLAARVPRTDMPRGSGLATAAGIAPSQMFLLEATLGLTRADEVPDVQLFVADDGDFSRQPQASSGGRELVAWLSAGQLKVVRDGKVVGSAPKMADKRQWNLTIRVSSRHAIVEVDGRSIFKGEHGLAADRPRYAGVRFLTRGQERTEALWLQSLRVLKP